MLTSTFKKLDFANNSTFKLNDICTVRNGFFDQN